MHHMYQLGFEMKTAKKNSVSFQDLCIFASSPMKTISLFEVGVFEDLVSVGEKNIEDPVANLHGRAQHNGDIL